MKRPLEHRLADIELREDEASGVLHGRAVVYDSITDIGGMFREVIRPGSMAKTLRESKDIKALWQHDSMYPMGSTRAGTLELKDTETGLEFSLDPPKKSPYDGFVENIQRGDVSQMSFGFRVVKENRVVEEGQLDLREITELQLIEISPVTWPAYEDTEIQARAADVVARWRMDETNEDGEGAQRTTPEPDTSVVHSVEPDGNVPDYVLNRCELDAAEEELINESL